ncbi:trypco2 family protein [Streptomyces phaeochromogenes]|uniref:trypco2 family protein n=1 Tax=Streptomyces phaeochromogenes TaxID=1923 RepID=UPI0036CA42DE
MKGISDQISDHRRALRFHSLEKRALTDIERDRTVQWRGESVAKGSEPIRLSEWIQALRQEVQAAQQSAGSQPMFELGSLEVEVDLCTTREATGRAGLRFWVVEGGTERKRGKSVTQRVRVTLSPLHTTLVKSTEGEAL